MRDLRRLDPGDILAAGNEPFLTGRDGARPVSCGKGAWRARPRAVGAIINNITLRP
jgi:hypothetical protein